MLSLLAFVGSVELIAGRSFTSSFFFSEIVHSYWCHCHAKKPIGFLKTGFSDVSSEKSSVKSGEFNVVLLNDMNCAQICKFIIYRFYKGRITVIILQFIQFISMMNDSSKVAYSEWLMRTVNLADICLN